MICRNQIQNPVQDASCVPIAQMNFIFRARMLWRDLASWLRAYYLCKLAFYDNDMGLQAFGLKACKPL